MKIVVPIDNTPAAQSLFDVLMGMQWYEGTEIVLCTVVPKWVAGLDAQVSIPASVRETESLAVELRNALPLCDVTFFVKEGDPKIEIASFARSVGAHLIIIGTTPPSPYGQPQDESIADAIISHAHCPVLVAKSNYESNVDPQSGFTTVLVPVDDSIYADIALQWLLNFRWSPRTRFIISSVVSDESAEAVASENLLRRASLLSTVLQTTNISMEVRSGNPTEAIISLARKYAADLVVIGSHGRVGLRKLIFGSVSEDLAHNGPCSIAIVRGIAEADESWHRTGVFRKPKVQQIGETWRQSPGSYAPSNQGSPHIPPCGMG